MWKAGSQNTDSHWDNIPNIMYEILFYEADNIQQIYRDQGLPVPEYHIHGNSHSYRDNYGSSTYLGEYSGDRGVSQVGPSFLDEYHGIQDDVNPEEMTYEQISELGQSIGTVKKGLSEEQMSRLPTHKYKASSKEQGKSANEVSECVICKMQYDKGDVLMTLPCAHKYHQECIKNWLKEDKSCCVCKEEVTV